MKTRWRSRCRSAASSRLPPRSLPNLLDLGRLDQLIAVDSGNYVNTPEVVAMLQDGALAEVGNGASINVELVLALAPDLVLANGFNPETDAHPVLLEAGVFTAINADWLEPSLPARAEWLKFIALFFNEEARAETLYAQLMADYDAAALLAATVPAVTSAPQCCSTPSRPTATPGSSRASKAGSASCCGMPLWTTC